MSNICLISENKRILENISTLDGAQVSFSDSDPSTVIPFLHDNSTDIEFLIGELTASNADSLPDIFFEVRQNYPAIKVAIIADSLDMNSADNQQAVSIIEGAGITVLFDYNASTIKAFVDNAQIDIQPSSVGNHVPENIIVITSAKAGSGKSFVSTNLATILALYGRKKKNGKGTKPTVLLVEGDLQTLSVGTLLGVANTEHNLKNTLLKIASIVDSEGNVTGTPEQQLEVQKFIEDCCLLVNKKLDNFATIVSAEFSLEEREKVSPYHYFYLLNILASLFDVVVVDSNSAIEHKTTGPVLQMARDIYMVVTADFDGVRIATKIREEYEMLGCGDKIRFVLNKCLTKQQQTLSSEQSQFNPEDYFDRKMIAAKIPFVDQVLQYNCIYTKTPVVMHKKPETLMARMAFTKLAANIWPMDNFSSLKKEINDLKSAKKK